MAHRIKRDYTADGKRVIVPNKEVWRLRAGYTCHALRRHEYTVAVCDENGVYIGWCPIEATGHDSVRAWLRSIATSTTCVAR